MRGSFRATLGAGSPGMRCAAVAAIVTLLDQGSKLLAAARLDGGTQVPLAGDTFLTLVYNDTFARGMEIGGVALPATLLLATSVLILVGRACTPLARVDRAAPVALGLVAGATIGNAADFIHTGRGAVDFLGVHTAGGALVFNLADVAAYAGVALLARSTWRIAALVIAERRAPAVPTAAASGTARRTRAIRAARTEPEIARPVPLFAEPGVPALSANSGSATAATGNAPLAPTVVPPVTTNREPAATPDRPPSSLSAPPPPSRSPRPARTR